MPRIYMTRGRLRAGIKVPKPSKPKPLRQVETPLQVAHRIEAETGVWLKEHGYNPSVAHIHLEAIHLQNKVVATDFMKELFLMRPHSPDRKGAKE